MKEEEEEEEEEEEYEDEKTVLEKVFGPSSDIEDEDEDDNVTYSSSSSSYWEQIHQIKGLWLCRNFLSLQKQFFLLSSIQAQHWFGGPNTNQAMRFGDLPPWAHHLSNSIHRSLLEASGTFSPLPINLLSREPFFDQMIANLYHPGEGICPHVDLLRFEDGIAIVSLESSCVMHFTPLGEEHGSVPVLLTPGSLVVMSGEARYNWKHEINRKPGFQVWEGKELEQSRRISITLRKLRPDP